MTTRIIKYKRGLILDDNYVYIGRKFAHFQQSKWANPFVIGLDGTREEVIEKYKQYLLGRQDLIDALPELREKILVCWCGGRAVGIPCHADVLIELMKELGIE